MSTGFVSSWSAAQQLGSTQSSFTSGCICTKQHVSSVPVARRSYRTARGPRMMAKFQQKEENNSQQLDEESELEKAIAPPPLLPTLTTLTGSPTEQTDIDLSRISGATSENQGSEDEKTISTMGAGLPAEKEFSLFTFFLAVVEEFKQVEWPSASRVARLTITIVVTLIVAAFALYLIDGFFYRMSQLLFEGKI